MRWRTDFAHCTMIAQRKMLGHLMFPNASARTSRILRAFAPPRETPHRLCALRAFVVKYCASAQEYGGPICRSYRTSFNLIKLAAMHSASDALLPINFAAGLLRRLRTSDLSSFQAY